jgi:signal transduction histidine kinase
VRRGSGFKIGRYLWLLAAFGLLHGLNEWLDMFLLLGSDRWGPAETRVVEIVRFFVGQVSYMFLLQFGVGLLVHGRDRCSWLARAAALICSAMIFALFAWGLRTEFSEHWFLSCDIAMRYVLAFPAAFLTATAFSLERKSVEIRRLDSKSVSTGLAGLAVAFALYAVFAGIIVKKAAFLPASVVNYEAFLDLTGLPVQFFRAACAIAAVVFLCKMLRIFELETKHKLEDAYREIIRISNREQMRIGQDLHDGLGQHLTGVAFMSKALEKQLGTKGLDEADTASQIRELIDRSIDVSSALSRGLYPVSLEKNGLGFALRELADNTEALFHVSCSASVDETVAVKDKEAAIHLFRIAQEAVSNAVKHGEPDSVRIELRKDRNTLVLSVTDDGVGIAEVPGAAEGLGLQTMRYRANVIGAELQLRKGGLGGTVMRCSIKKPGISHE